MIDNVCTHLSMRASQCFHNITHLATLTARPRWHLCMGPIPLSGLVPVPVAGRQLPSNQMARCHRTSLVPCP